MTSISTTTLSSLTAKTTDSTKKAADTYSQFLTLLTTQLKNQDPLDPADSSEFTNQLVQFSQVEQQILGNEKMDTLLSQINNTQIGQSLGYIGKDVFYKGNSIYAETGDSTKIGYAIDGAPVKSSIHIYDKDSNLIRTISLPSGTISGNISWDGKDDSGNAVPTGTYTLTLDSLDATGGALKSYTGVPGHVEGVETTDGVLYLALKGDSRIDATNVLSISEPDTITAPKSTDTGSTT